MTNSRMYLYRNDGVSNLKCHSIHNIICLFVLGRYIIELNTEIILGTSIIVLIGTLIQFDIIIKLY